MKVQIKDDFKNLLEYRQWVEEKFKRLSSKNHSHQERFTKAYIDTRLRGDTEWFGKGVTFEQLQAGITEYKDPGLIDRIYQQVSEQISTQTRESLKARKVRYNPAGLGVFVFDRAAMGLYRLKEFYSTKHQKAVQREEVNFKTSPISLEKDGSKITERWEEKENGKAKVRTNNKNVFAYYPPVQKLSNAVELFISCGGNSKVEAEAFLYSGISALIVAELLEKARIKTRISIVIGSAPADIHKAFYGCMIPVKNYDEKLDRNLLALLTSDPRFFRFEGLKGIIAAYDHFGAVAPSNLGYGVTRQTLPIVLEESGYAKEKNLSENRFYFGWTFNETDAVEIITEGIQQISQRLNIA